MARKGVTFEDVERAAAELRAKGQQQPTQMAVRAHLGTGSTSTIHRHLQVLRSRDHHSEQLQEIPPEVETVLKQTISTVWTQATAIAMREIEAIRDLAHRRTEQAEVELSEMNEAYDLLTADLEKSQSQVTHLESKVQALESELAVSIGKAEVLSEQITELLAQLKPPRSRRSNSSPTTSKRQPPTGKNTERKPRKGTSDKAPDKLQGTDRLQ